MSSNGALQLIKLSLKSPIAHGRATYEEPQALGVMNHVRTFFEALSVRLAEVV